MDIYWKSSTADVKHPRAEPRPGSRADVAPDLPATKARKPAVQENGNENRGSDKGGGQKSKGAAPRGIQPHTGTPQDT